MENPVHYQTAHGPSTNNTGGHLPSDTVGTQSSLGGHSLQPQPTAQQSVSLDSPSRETTHNNENHAASKSSSPRPSWRQRWLRTPRIRISRWFLIFTNASSLVWGFFYVYPLVFPLSVVDRTVRATEKTWSIFTQLMDFWLKFCVAQNFLYLYLWIRSSLSAPDNAQLTLPAEPPPPHLTLRPFTFIIKAMIPILTTALLSLPIWWYSPLQAGWQRAVWQHDACLDWELSITMSTLHFDKLGVPGKLSSATLLNPNRSKFIMELSHPASNISAISLFAGSNSMPPISDMVVNFTTLTYTTSTNLSGSFTNSPLLSFPELSLHSQYPRIAWSFPCFAPRFSLVDSDNHVVLRTKARNYDDCAQLKACGSGNIETLAVPLSVTLIELEKAGLCCTNPYFKRLNDSNPTLPSDTKCSSISKYLYHSSEQIPANPDISGKGVRYTVYAQALLNNVVALLGHTADEAISLNAANAVAILALTFASAYMEDQDWPHLIVIYYFFLFIWLSGVSYNTVQPQLRTRAEFAPFIERLTNIDIIILPFFVTISLALWFGILIAQHRQKMFPSMDCVFGRWVFFGRTIDLKTTDSVTIGLTLAVLSVAWAIGSLSVDTLFRRISYKRLSRIRGRMQVQDGVSMIPTLSSNQQETYLVGNYSANWIWQHVEPILSSRVFTCILPFRLGLRKLTFCWRFAIWGYLVAATEQLISANGFQDEQKLTFGQAYALSLLIVPMGVLWHILYRASPSFARYFNSPGGRYSILYTASGFLGIAYSIFVLVLVEKALFRIILLLIVFALFYVPVVVRQNFSQEVNQRLRTTTYPPASSFWEMWSAELEIRLPDSAHDPVVDTVGEGNHPHQENAIPLNPA